MDVSFWESSFIWRDAMVVLCVCAAALAYLGVWAALKQVVYVPLAFTQVSALGVALAFLGGEILNRGLGEAARALRLPALLDPAVLSLAVTVSVSFYFARARDSGENSTVFAYLGCSALFLILGGFLRSDIHGIEDILFGNAVLVEAGQVRNVIIALVAVALIHLKLFKRFLFVSLDREAAGAAGIRTYRAEVIFYATLAVMISIATRAIGALPVFGLAALPAMAAMRAGASMRWAFIAAPAIGIFCAACGYYISFKFEIPAGAAIVALAALIYILSVFYSRIWRPGE